MAGSSRAFQQVVHFFVGRLREIRIPQSDDDGAHRELVVPGQSQLPHDEDVEWRAERVCDLEADGHAAAWKRHDDEVGAMCVAPKVVRQPSAGIAPIAKAGLVSQRARNAPAAQLRPMSMMPWR